MSSRQGRARLAALIAVAALALVGCDGGGGGDADGGDGGGDEGAELSLSANDNEFDPAELAVTPGEEVTVNFTNDGDTIHTFTSDELGFDTGNVEPGASETVTFTAPGAPAAFVCTLHQASDNMTGQILPNM